MRRFLIVCIVASFASLMGCDHELDGPDPKGQEYLIPSENFSVDTADDNSRLIPENTNINFQDGDVQFGVLNFNETATWKIEITGRQSQAKKTLSGTSNELDPEKVKWSGESDNVYFFKRLERCDVVFSVLGTDFKLAEEFRLARLPEFRGILVGDFEDQDNAVIPGDEFNRFFDVNGTDEAIASGRYPDITPESVIPDLPHPVQGDKYTYLRGKDDPASPDPFFIGGFNNTSLNFGLEDRPLDEIFLNFYASTNGNKTTNLIVELTGVGGDLFRANKQVALDGWKKISIKLSEFVLYESGELGPNVIFPEDLKQLAFQIHSGGGLPGNEAELCIDYIVFTYGSPFKQEK